jgi:hypothetical protein
MYAISETFRSGFLFDNTIKILRKTKFTYPCSEQRKLIILRAFFKECELFTFFKTIVLSFHDYWLIDKCVAVRGDFIFATSIYYWKNTSLIKRAMNNCIDAYYLLNNHTYKHIHKKIGIYRHNLEDYTFNIIHDCYHRYYNDFRRNIHIYLTRCDNNTTIRLRIIQHKNKSAQINIKQNYGDLNYHENNHNSYYDYYDSFGNVNYHNYEHDYDAIFDKRNYDETFCHSKKIKNDKEVSIKKWSSKKIIKKCHKQNKNSRKSRKIISMYKSACI